MSTRTMKFGDSHAVVSMEEVVVGPSGTTSHSLNLYNQLAVTVAELSHRMPGSVETPGILYTQSVPGLPKFYGHPKNGNQMLPWVKDAREHLEQLGPQGKEAVKYLCSYLQCPALTRVRNSKAGTAKDVTVCLEWAFGLQKK